MGALLERWSNKRKKYKLLYGLWSLVGLVAAIAVNEMHYEVDNAHSYAIRASIVVLTLTESLKLVTLVTTLIALYYHRKFSLARLRLMDPSSTDTGLNAFRRCNFLGGYLFEIAILLPMPLPFLSMDVRIYDLGMHKWTWYNTDEFLVALMFLRLWIVPFVFADNSRLSAPGVRAIGKVNYCTVDTKMVLKQLINHSGRTVGLLFVCEVLAFSYLLMLFERPQLKESPLTNYFNCIWLVIITMTTVGFGDVCPTTMLGRLVAIVASLTALVMFALIVNVVMEKLQLSRQEARVVAVCHHLRQQRELKNHAAGVIARAVRLSIKLTKLHKGDSVAGVEDLEKLPVTNRFQMLINEDWQFVQHLRTFKVRRMKLKLHSTHVLDDEYSMLVDVLTQMRFMANERAAESARITRIETEVSEMKTTLNAIAAALNVTVPPP